VAPPSQRHALYKLLIKTVAIIGFIANKFVRSIPSKPAINSCLDKLYFMGRIAQTNFEKLSASDFS